MRFNQYVRLQNNIFDIVTETDDAERGVAARKLTLLMWLPLTLQPNQTVSVYRPYVGVLVILRVNIVVIGAVLCYGVNIIYFCRSPSQHYFSVKPKLRNINAAKRS